MSSTVILDRAKGLLSRALEPQRSDEERREMLDEVAALIDPIIGKD